jgi:hypothetical protein
MYYDLSCHILAYFDRLVYNISYTLSRIISNIVLHPSNSCVLSDSSTFSKCDA